jgi:integrase
MVVKELTALQVKRLTEPGFYGVGGVTGLYLRIAPGGSKSWILRYVYGTKRRDFGIGGYPDVTLADAREAARKARQQIREGIDPVEERKRLKREIVKRQTEQITLKEAALKVYEKKASEHRSKKHSRDWINSLRLHVFPSLGHIPLSEITNQDVLRILEPIWHTKTETASRIRQRIETVFDWAEAVSGVETPDKNPARWEGNLKELLPLPSKISKVKHHRALPWQQMGEFMERLRERGGVSARALEFAILTAARSGEVRGMRWEEVDFDSKVWTLPEGRTKSGRVHKVPLSKPALDILKTVPRMKDSPLVFTAPRGGELSDMALLAVVRKMDVDCVPHGFRSSFKDWSRSNTSYPDEVSELALAHVNSDSTRAAYARDELLPKRKRLMDDWAKFCGSKVRSGNVVPIKADSK